MILLLPIQSIFGKNSIKHIRFGSQSGPLSGLTVTWRSAGETDKIRWGYTDKLEKGLFVKSARKGYADNFFDYTFPELNPRATIHYKLFDSKNSTWTKEKTFTTASDPNGDKTSFIILGDSRTDVGRWGEVSAAANSEHADFTLFMGDIVDIGAKTRDWDRWFKSGSKFIEKNLIYHCIGNHECNGKNGNKIYVNNFTLPRNSADNSEYYYSFTHGNTLFLSLDTDEAKTGVNPETQYAWLRKTLEANKDKKWKIIWFHKPFLTAGGHVGDMNKYYDTWFKTFDEYGVDLIFNGHDHVYERSKPVVWEKTDIKKKKNPGVGVVPRYGSKPDQGICQIVSGGAGVKMHLVKNPEKQHWLERWNPVTQYQHYCKIEINGDTLKFQAIHYRNVVFDALILTKK